MLTLVISHLLIDSRMFAAVACDRVPLAARQRHPSRTTSITHSTRNRVSISLEHVIITKVGGDGFWAGATVAVVGGIG